MVCENAQVRRPKDVRALASINHPAADIGASISSGSFATMGMIIVPCSIRTMSEDRDRRDLVARFTRRRCRARRKSAGLLLALHEGAAARRPSALAGRQAVRHRRGGRADRAEAFYNKPKSVDDIINHTVGRLLDLLGIETKLVKRWGRRPGGRLEQAIGRNSWTRKPTTSA